MVASLFWVRGREPGVRRRLRLARRASPARSARAAGVAIVLILVLGGFIFYNTNILNEYRTADEGGAPQAEYEQRYKRFEDARSRPSSTRICAWRSIPTSRRSTCAAPTAW